LAAKVKEREAFEKQREKQRQEKKEATLKKAVSIEEPVIFLTFVYNSYRKQHLRRK
jgi:hypothetical protein